MCLRMNLLQLKSAAETQLRRLRRHLQRQRVQETRQGLGSVHRSWLHRRDIKGVIRLELMQTVNGEPKVSVIVEDQTLQFPYQLDVIGEPGVTDGTIYLYELVGDDYQLEGQYPVTFKKVE